MTNTYHAQARSHCSPAGRVAIGLVGRIALHPQPVHRDGRVLVHRCFATAEQKAKPSCKAAVRGITQRWRSRTPAALLIAGYAQVAGYADDYFFAQACLWLMQWRPREIVLLEAPDNLSDRTRDLLCLWEEEGGVLTNWSDQGLPPNRYDFEMMVA